MGATGEGFATDICIPKLDEIRLEKLGCGERWAALRNAYAVKDCILLSLVSQQGKFFAMKVSKKPLVLRWHEHARTHALGKRRFHVDA